MASCLGLSFPVRWQPTALTRRRPPAPKQIAVASARFMAHWGCPSWRGSCSRAAPRAAEYDYRASYPVLDGSAGTCSDVSHRRRQAPPAAVANAATSDAAVAPVAAERLLLRGLEDEPRLDVIAIGKHRRRWGQRGHIRCGSGFSCRRQPATCGLADETCPDVVSVSKRPA